MLDFYILSLPSVVCIVCFFFFLIVGKKTHSRKNVLWLFAVGSVFFLTNACYMCAGTSMEVLAVSSILGQLATPCMLPLVALYLYSFQNRHSPPFVAFFWGFLPAACFSVAMLCYIVLGASHPEIYQIDPQKLHFDDPLENRVFKMNVAVNIILFRVILAFELLFTIGYMVVLSFRNKYSARLFFRFAFKGEALTPMQLQLSFLYEVTVVCLADILITREFAARYPFIPMIVSLLSAYILVMFLAVAFFEEYKKPIRLSRIISSLAFDPNLLDENANPYVMDTSFRLSCNVADERVMLLERFLITEKHALDPYVSIEQAAEYLQITKRDMTNFMAEFYYSSFVEYVNRCRLDFAQKYMLEHPNAKQSEIAETCGFTSVPSFNNLFKRTFGVTPKIWLVNSKK